MFGDPEDCGIFSGWSQQLNTFYLQQLQQPALDTFGVCVCVCLCVCAIAYAVVLLFVRVSFTSPVWVLCARVFVSHSMRVLDGSCGFAVVVISLRVGWTNLSIQFLPLVFSPMREPRSLFSTTLRLRQNTSLWQTIRVSYLLCMPSASLTPLSLSSLLPWLPLTSFLFSLFFLSTTYSCVALHVNGLEPWYHSNIGALGLFQRHRGERYDL